MEFSLTHVSLRLWLCLLIIPGCLTSVCQRLSGCSCKKDDGFVFDLSTLSNSDNTPRFQDVPSALASSTVYSWNPCSDFDEGTCNDVAVCQAAGSGGFQQYNGLGTAGNAQFEAVKNGIDIKYTDGQQPVTIHVICEKNVNGVFSPIGDKTGSGTIEMTLTTKLACDTKGLSPGTYICFILLGLLVVYLVGGILVQVVIRKERGKQALPNYNFWTSFPGLVKDGVFFTVKCGKSKKGYSGI